MSFFPKGFLLPPAPDAVSSRSVSSDQSDRKLSATSSHEVNEKVSEHLCCGICLDLLVHPQTVAPCGHTYCAKCLAGVEKENDDKCPECRTVMVSVVPALQLKGVIEALVTTMPGMFAEGDVDHYHERLKTEQCGGFKKIKSAESVTRKRSRSFMRAELAAMAATRPSRVTAMPESFATSFFADRRIRGRDRPVATYRLEPTGAAGDDPLPFWTSANPNIRNYFGRDPVSTTTTTTTTTTRHAGIPAADWIRLASEMGAEQAAENAAAASVGGETTAGGITSLHIHARQPQPPHTARQPQGTSVEDAICLD